MNKIIQKIEISGFRSIDRETIDASDVNIFSGTNDSGKSNILRALNLFFNLQPDFQKPLKFNDDYNKVSFARATMSAKMKQQIKIRIYFNIPATYKSLLSEDEVFLEKTFDRNGKLTEKYSNDAKRSQITRLVNKINYIYIPALKGEAVLEYLLALIGEYQLIGQDDIEALNQQINNKTKDLSDLLQASKISIGTTFGLPVFLSDF
jgi:predicted ATP-dependent endonuclease of OLD family